MTFAQHVRRTALDGLFFCVVAFVVTLIFGILSPDGFSYNVQRSMGIEAILALVATVTFAVTFFD